MSLQLKVIILSSGIDTPGQEEGVCKIISCLNQLYNEERGLCEVHYYRREKAEEVLDEYPDPLCWLLTRMVERNCQEWIAEKPDTRGADQVRKTGLTSNQKRWADEIAEMIEEGETDTMYSEFANKQRSDGFIETNQGLKGRPICPDCGSLMKHNDSPVTLAKCSDCISEYKVRKQTQVFVKEVEK